MSVKYTAALSALKILLNDSAAYQISLKSSLHSPLTTHHSPLTTHHSPLTTHHSPLTTHHSPQWFTASSPQYAPHR
ncbi:MAG: hypothetical protein ABIR15_00165 [Chitinophagaceae bacterium]